MRRASRVASLTVVLLVGGCATIDPARDLQEAVALAGDSVGAAPRLLRSDDERREARATVQKILAEPLAIDDAVRIAVAYSPAMQASLHDGAARSAAAVQSARLPNPVFTFERLLRPGGLIADIKGIWRSTKLPEGRRRWQL